MKQETNNEIDLLLRRLSRRQEVSVSDDDSHIDSDHLDADELSSYAENALPAAARARYTEHLADCSKCREIVVQLSASVPVVAARETVTAVQPSWLRNFLASFFSPMVLRYAVPALGLVIVAAIGFVVLRQNAPRQSVAQLQGERQEAASGARAPEPEQQPVFSYDSRGQLNSPASSAASRPAEVDKTRNAAEPPPPSQNAPSSAGAGAGVAQPKTETREQKAEDQVAANTAPASAAPAPNPGATVDEMRVDIQGRKANEQAKTDLAKQKTAEAAEEQEKRAAGVQSAREPARARTMASPDSVGGRFSVGQERDKDLEAGVTRTVAGRRFRKQGNQWVDTAYNSGSAIVSVSRGSEQYKALIADEPSIKTIADELDGVIIVVWKRSTYRIR